MKQFLTRFCCLLGGLVGTSQLASAQITYFPAALTPSSYTADVIAEGTGTVASRTSTAFDTGTAAFMYCLVNTTYVNPSGQSPTLGLPASGLLTSAVTTTPGLTFQLAPAGSGNSASPLSNNSLHLLGATSGTMTLVTPAPANEVVVLGAEGNSTSTSAGKTFVVNFTDGTSQTFTNILMPDWFDGANPAVTAGSRVSRVDNGIENGPTNPRLYQARLMLSATNYGKLVASVTASKTTAAPAVLNVMGITLGISCQGIPNAGTAVAAPAGICAGQQVALSPSGATAAGGITFQWQVSNDGGVTWTNIAGATGATYIGMPTVTTSYRVILTCSGQSGTSVPATVTVAPTTSSLSYATPPATATFCNSGTQAVVTATPAGGTFSAPSGLSINATTGTLNLAASTAGTYTVTYAQAAGSCTPPATTSVTVLPTATVSLSFGGTTFCKAGAAPVTTASPAGGAFGSTTGLVINSSTGVVDLAASTNGTYTVTYTITGQCGGQASARITVQGSTPPVYPNVLTPNGDQLNDVLKLKIADVQNYSLQVFNRWGRRVYEGNNANEGWDAANNGAGTYFYQVEYTDCAGRAQTARNWIEVIK